MIISGTECPHSIYTYKDGFKADHPDYEYRNCDDLSDLIVVLDIEPSIYTEDPNPLVEKMAYAQMLPDGPIIASEPMDTNMFLFSLLETGHYEITAVYTPKDSVLIKQSDLILEDKAIIEVKPNDLASKTWLNIDHSTGSEQADGSVQAAWYLPSSPPTFKWPDNSTGMTWENLLPGDYSVTLLKPGQCPIDIPFTIGIKGSIKFESCVSLSNCFDPKLYVPESSICSDTGILCSPESETICNFLIYPGSIDTSQWDDDDLLSITFDIANPQLLEAALNFIAEDTNQNFLEWFVQHPPFPQFTHSYTFTGEYLKSRGLDGPMKLYFPNAQSMTVSNFCWSQITQPQHPLEVSFTVAEHLNFRKSFTDTIVICMGESVLPISYFDISGGTSPYSFNWDLDGDQIYDDFMGDSLLFSPDAPGDFPIGLFVVDAFGQTATQTITIVTPSKNSIELIAPDIPNIVAGGFYSMCTEDEPVEIFTNYLETAIMGSIQEGNIFDPTEAGKGLHILYQQGNNPCDEVEFLKIVVEDIKDSSWDPFQFDTCDTPIVLSQFITGDPGGYWSLDGLTPYPDSLLYPSDFEPGEISLYYGHQLYHCNELREGTIVIGSCGVTSTKDFTIEPGIVIGPNPATSFFSVYKSESSISGIKIIEVYDISGNTLMVANDNESDMVTIHVGHLTNGLYFVKVLLKNDEMWTGKIIVQR